MKVQPPEKQQGSKRPPLAPRVKWLLDRLPPRVSAEVARALMRRQFLMPGTGQMKTIVTIVGLAGAVFLGVALALIWVRVSPNAVFCDSGSPLCESFVPGGWGSLAHDLLELLLFTGLSAAAMVGATVILTHRIFGPIVKVHQMIDALARGEYGFRITLRNGDYFHELARKLNSLAETLEERHGSRDESRKSAG